MKFRFIISKQANFYFFVSNLSEWHFSCEKDYNILWQKELEKFSSEEIEVLKKFKTIRLKYPSGKSLFERAFFTNKTPFLKLKKSLPANEYKVIEEVFKTMKKKFDSLYKKEFSLLKIWEKELDIKANNATLSNSIIKILQNFFVTVPKINKINVYLLFSSGSHTGGGANIDGESVSLEISRYPIEYIDHAQSIIWHEIIHLLFQNEYFNPKLMEILKDRQKAKIVNEVAIASLFPRGILGQKFFKTQPTDTLHSEINLGQTKKILNLTGQIISDHKSFDEEYIRKMAKILRYKIHEY